MNKAFFKEDNSIECYLTIYFNVVIYRELTEISEYNGLFDDPLEFMKILWKTYNYIIENKSTPLKNMNYVHSIYLKDDQLLYLIENLVILFDKRVILPYISGEVDEKLIICVDFLMNEALKIKTKLRHNIGKVKHLFDFEFIKTNMALVKGNIKRIEYLNNAKKEFIIKNPILNLNTYNDQNQLRFDLAIEAEIAFLETSGMLHENLAECSPAVPDGLYSEKGREARNFIASTIIQMDTSGWRYAFTCEADFIMFCDVYANFFENQNAKTPFNTLPHPDTFTDIEFGLTRLCKTRFCVVLNTIYRQHCDIPMPKNKNWIILCGKLSIFKGLNNTSILHSIRRFNEHD